MATVTMRIRCPHCKYSIELDKDGMATCCGCGYEVNINRYN